MNRRLPEPASSGRRRGDCDGLTFSPPPALRLSRQQWRRMEKHVARQAPLEACGLLGGRAGVVLEMVLVPNVLRSPCAFRMDPAAQVAALLRFEELGYDTLAIFHSHPQGPLGLSARDLAELGYPEAVHLVWAPSQGEWRCRAFVVQNREAREIPLLVEEDATC